MSKAEIYCIGNQKGGVGKTTTTENLGIGMAREGKKVLLIDLDPQASLSIALGNDRPDNLEITVTDVMKKMIEGEEIPKGYGILHHEEGVDLLPANIELAGMEASLVDANLQREEILPSERAQAYKMKLEAIKHQGQRRDLTSGQVVQKFKTSVEQVAEGTGESYKNVQRYIRLTELIPELQEMVDTKQLAFNPAVELSYLSDKEQHEFIDAMDYGQATPSLSQAQRIKTLSKDGLCTKEAMCAVMSEEKKPEPASITLKDDVLRKYFPKSYTTQQMEQMIIKLLDQWQKKRERQQER